MINNGFGGYEPFGGFFDLNGDGRTDFFEETLGYKIFEDEMEDTFDSDFDDNFCDDFDDYDDDDDDEDLLSVYKNAWRDTCEDGSEAEISDNEEVEDSEHSDNPDERQDDECQLRELKQETADISTGISEPEDMCKGCTKGRKYLYDPLAEFDNDIYIFCGVQFANSDEICYYRTEDESLTIGDKVIVPVGNDGKEAVAEIVTFEKHRRKTAPSLVEETEFIIGEYKIDY